MKTKPTFRRRVFLSTILPVLVLLPLLGLALLYIIENQLLLPTLANEMIDQGFLVERLVQEHPDVWDSQTDAQALLDSIHFQRPSRIGLLDPDHVLLATTRPDDLVLVGKLIENIPNNLSLDDSWWKVTPGDLPREQILEVIVPVKKSDGNIIGLVRIYRRITDIEQNLATIRYIILGVLVFGLLITGLIAFAVSDSLDRPIKALTKAISDSPLAGKAQPLPENADKELAELTHAYNRLQERRQELEDSRQRMLANLIHEIGRPLGSIRTAIHALKSGAADNKKLRTELFDGMTERVNRIGLLLEDMALAYRGLEPQEILIKRIQVKEWLQSLIPLWAESARQKGIKWEVVSTNAPDIIENDPNRLAQVLSNLVDNAIKFTPADGQVTFTVQTDEDKVQFQVSDTGIGIPLENQRHLFIPFYRSVQPSWKAPGLGLGLSIAKSITESLGGQLVLTSNPNEGSKFTATFPIEQDN
jgi:signal transduction histidine kinase